MHLFGKKGNFLIVKGKLIKEGSGIAGLIMPHAIFGYFLSCFVLTTFQFQLQIKD